MIRYTVLILLFHVTLSSAAIYQCKDVLESIKDDSGYLLIDRSLPSCGFNANQNNFFGLKVNNLKLYDGENLIITPNKETEKTLNISGPIDSDYLIFSMIAIKIEFKLKNLGQNQTSMLLEFFQNKEVIPIDVDRATELTIKSYNADHYDLAFSKSINNPVHLQILGTGDKFGHHLMSNNSQIISVKKIVNNPIYIKASSARQDCSKSYSGKSLDPQQISGPDASTINNVYKCVNIFDTDLTGQAHFDVSFDNFLDLVDDYDELIIDDGVQSLKITRSSASYYYQQKPTISFRGQKLAVIYNSPIIVKPKAIFKITVQLKEFGGIIDDYQILVLPPKGNVRYTLKPRDNDSKVGLQITSSGKILGVDMKISDTLGNVITMDATKFAPPVIALKRGQEVSVEFNVLSKVTNVFNYSQVDDCSATIFEKPETISISGNNRTCHVLIKPNSTLSVDYHNLGQTNSCLEIYSLEKETPIFTRCNINPVEILSSFSLGLSYLKIKTASKFSRFDASIKQTVSGLVTSSKDFQTHYRSNGYPTAYIWSPYSDRFSFDARSKSVLLSVADVDIRAGEKLAIDGVEINNLTSSTVGDIDMSKKLVNITLTRSLNTNDFKPHRGYSLVMTEYQAIISANLSKTSIQTPQNLTSLLFKIRASQSMRLYYNIQNATTTNQNYVMKVIDSRTLVGREVYSEERLNGSTTADTLLVSFATTKAGISLPTFTINYKQIACNKTSDHVCDQLTRCVPAAKLCKGKSYCMDGSDLQVSCSSGPAPPPQIITTGGYSGVSVFFIMILMFAMGVMAAIYGPDMYKRAESRFRSGQYSSFTSAE